MMTSLPLSLQANKSQWQVASVRDLEVFHAIFHGNSNGMSGICSPCIMRVVLSVGEPVVFW